MFDQPYKFNYKDKKLRKEKSFEFFEHKLTFRSKDSQRYIVNVEEYPHHVHAIKFHLKAHSDSDDKYNLLTGFFDAPRLISTCVEVMLDFYKKNPYASFGFIGANSKGESKINTKRFRIYRRVMENFFSPLHFDHYIFEKESGYLMLNRDYSEPDLFQKVEVMFRDCYDFEEL